MKKFLQKIRSLPEPLQRQIWLRFSLAALLFIFGLVSAIVWRDKSMLIIIAVAVFFAVLGFRISYREYIIFTGTCIEVEPTIIRRRNKAVTITTMAEGKERALRIPLRQQFRKIAAGDLLEVYVDAAAMIYEREGVFHLQSHICIDKTRISS